MVRVGHRRLRRPPVAQLPVEAEVAGCGGVKRGRVLTQRGLGIRDRRERFTVDRDRLGRRPGLGGALRHHEGDRIAHHAHAPRREHRARHQGCSAAVGPLGRHHAGNRADPGVGQIGGGVDRQHPRHRRRSARVDRAQRGMGVGRAHHRAPGLARQREVVEVAPAPGEEALVLQPPCRCADTVRHPAPALPCVRAHVK